MRLTPARLLLLSVTAASLVGCGGGDDAVGAASDPQREAAAACEAGVLRELAAPATAQFPEDGRVETELKPGDWLVIGKVDAENNFGALLRRSYQCDVAGPVGAMVATKVLILGG